MKRNLKFPLDIQLFAESNPTPDPTPNSTPVGYSQEQLDAIAEARAARASDAALKDFFKQQGLSQQEITAALDKYKADKAASKPNPDALQNELKQAQQEAAKARLENQATMKALELGIDMKQIPYVLKLADIQISDEEVKDEDIKAAIEKVLEDVPALKSQEPTPKPGITLGADGNPAPKPKGNVSLTDAIASKLGK